MTRSLLSRGAWWLVAVTLSGCASLPSAPPRQCQPLAVGPGPEDFVVETAGSLLVSVHDRRVWSTPGEIQRVDLASGAVVTLPRIGEPAGLSFRPHGVDLVRDAAGEVLLYVVLHGPEPDGAGHAVARYRVEADRLVFRDVFTDPSLISPNDVSALPDGSFYVSNDAGRRGSRWELIWRLRRANVLYRATDGRWRVAADRLAFANGVYVAGERVFVSTTRGDSLIEYRRAADGTLTAPRKLADITGADNIMPLGADLLVTSHPRGIAFLRHVKRGSRPSPTVVYRVGRDDAKRAVFVDDGVRASAAATAAYVGGRLYVGQAFNAGILACEASDLAPAGADR